MLPIRNRMIEQERTVMNLGRFFLCQLEYQHERTPTTEDEIIIVISIISILFYGDGRCHISQCICDRPCDTTVVVIVCWRFVIINNMKSSRRFFCFRSRIGMGGGALFCTRAVPSSSNNNNNSTSKIRVHYSGLPYIRACQQVRQWQ